jgi:deoxyribodipyrimidine photo-lyase
MNPTRNLSTPISFPTDYDAILQRMANVDPIEYGRTRNFTNGAVSYLSPYISRGVISGKQVRDMMLARGYHAETIDRFHQELGWREYFQRVWQEKGDAILRDLVNSQTRALHHRQIASIVNASTGINAIDEHIKAFHDTGYLHNHVRMYVASITCNIGKAHWLTPARWMYANLLDGDLASNMCSWQWVAGTFSNKQYYCNQENINRFTNTYQHNTFLDTQTELLHETDVPPTLQAVMPWELKTKLPMTRQPAIDIHRPTLLYNSYNLDPLWRKDENVNRVLLLEPSHFERFPVSQKVIEFIIALSRNIPEVQLVVGEISALESVYKNATGLENIFFSKEHPAFRHYPGIKDERDWMYPQVTGYHRSFSSFWKMCRKTQ